ncbi:DUF3748 domain-containing protein [Spirosoma lituiforme]
MIGIEQQLTNGNQGHTIHHTQVFSPTDEWIVYDTRRQEDDIAGTASVEMINVRSQKIRPLYKTTNQTEFGPGVGAATFSPVSNRVLFMHGLKNATQANPYGFTRRTGVCIDLEAPHQPVYMDARHIAYPYTAGALRGGTHAHSWSGDGQWISFTYNDYVLEQLGKADTSVKDLRVIGVMAPFGEVSVHESDSGENHSGAFFSVIVTQVIETPLPASDQIDRAFDECWIGRDGYQKRDGTWQKRAIAFQGQVRTEANIVKTELFVVDLPDDLTQAIPNCPLEGTSATRPYPPLGTVQRRLTYTKQGVQGPRHWLRTTHNGSLIGFLANDNQGLVQVFGIPPTGGNPVQLTYQPYSVQSQFNFSPNDQYIAYAADNSVFITDISTGQYYRLTKRSSGETRPVGGIVWSNKGHQLAYNRYIPSREGVFAQLFLLTGFVGK